MSLEELRNMGLLRAESDWTGAVPRSGVMVPAMLAAALVGAAGCAAILIGNGARLTWFGVGGFLIGLFAFIAVNLHGIGRRVRRPAPPPKEDPDGSGSP